MAISDARYKLIYVDVGCNGRLSDGGIFNKCSFGKAMDMDKLSLPIPAPLPGREKPVPFVLVADDAFALRPNLMKPFPGQDLSATQRIHNLRLSRARHVVENTFGIMARRFQVLRKPINLDADKTKRVTLAICALHNLLIDKNLACYESSNLTPGESNNHDGCGTMEETEEIPVMPEKAKEIREEFSAYFVSPIGELDWQYENI